MLVILSPTKKQQHCVLQQYSNQPLFFIQSQKILDILKSKPKSELKVLYKTSDKLTASTFDMLHNPLISPALFLYRGEAFRALNPHTLSHSALNYAKHHLRIFSSAYGLLRPDDCIQSYRLDFMTPFDFNLISYWSNPVTEALNALEQPIVNCASHEFSQLIQRNKLTVPIYDIIFLSRRNEEDPKILSTHSKHARGLFARYIIENQISDLEQLKQFNEDNYTFYRHEKNALLFIKVLT